MYKRYWAALLALIILSPLGLLADGTAWGEWESAELEKTVGFLPQGMENLKDMWQAVFPDYSMPFLGEGGISGQIGYVLSAIIGSIVIYAIMTVISRILCHKKMKESL